MQLLNSYQDIRFPICKYLIAGSYPVIQQSRRLCSQSERPWSVYFIQYPVGFYNCGLDEFKCLEYFLTSRFVAILLTLWNGGDWQTWHHICHWVLGFLSSIGIWDRLNCETNSGNSVHCILKLISWDTSFWFDRYKRWWNRFDYAEERRQSRI
jgi:hypothetical protein